jgi:hypothetical protein
MPLKNWARSLRRVRKRRNKEKDFIMNENMLRQIRSEAEEIFMKLSSC